jgi:hypothetical protein
VPPAGDHPRTASRLDSQENNRHAPQIWRRESSPCATDVRSRPIEDQACTEGWIDEKDSRRS